MNLIRNKVLSWKLRRAFLDKDRTKAEKLEKVNSDVLNYPVQDESGHCPLTLAVHQRSISNVEFVLSLGANPNISLNVNTGLGCFHYLAQRSDYSEKSKKIFQLLTNCGIRDLNIDFECIQPLSDGTQISQTALMMAVIYENVEYIKDLLSHNANVNFIESMIGATPLLLACGQANYEIIKILIEAGADIKQSSSGQHGPLHWLCSSNDDDRDVGECVYLLFNEGAICNQQTLEDQVTPLMMAASSGLYNIVCALLDCGADPAIQDSFGRSAINYARMCEDVELMNLMLNEISKDRYNQKFD